MSFYQRLITFRTSFRFRLFVIFTLSTALITVTFTSFYIAREINAGRKQAAERVRLLASLLASSVRLPLYAEDRQTLTILAAEAARYPHVYRVVIRNSTGTALVDLKSGNQVSSDHIESETTAVTAETLAVAADSALTGAQPPPPATLGTVRIDLDTTEISRRIHRLTLAAAGIALGFWLIVLNVSYLILRKVTRSLNALMSGVETIRNGNYSARIETDADDEPGRAAHAINELAESLAAREAENRRLQQELFEAMRLEVQQEKKQLMAKLIQTNRMTSLGLMVSGMAHEINNPNGSIRLAGQYLGRSWKDTVPVLDGVLREEGDFSIGGIPYSVARGEIFNACDTIRRNTERIEHVIRDLRAYSLGERNEFRRDIDVNEVVNGALAIVRAHGQLGDVSLRVDLTDGLPPVTGNRHQLEQVAINLLLNAMQAMAGRQGFVTVTTGIDGKSGEVQIVVSDEGEGISVEHREHIFEPFFSTRLDRGGSGLGLYISNFIVSEHHGRLDIHSVLGAGTRVTVRLPVIPASAHRPAHAT